MNRRKNLDVVVGVWVFLAVLAGPAAGRTIYVDPNGSADFTTIQAAINDPCTINGDEIEVAPGTYNEAINFKGKAVRLYSSGGPEVTTIDGSLINSFRDDFNDGDYAGWQIVDQGNTSTPSSWSASTGEMIQSSNIYTEPTSDERFLGTYALCRHQMHWGDYEVTVSMKALDDERMGVMFRYVDPNNYYRFAWNGTSPDRRLVKMEDGSVTTLQQDNSSYVVDQWYQLKIAVRRENLKVFVDDVPVFDVNDGNFSSGAIALYCWGNRGTYFDDIEVKWSVFHVVQCVNGEDANTILEGFTITGGRASGPDMNDKYGGGMFCDSSSPTVTNCIFSDNCAVFQGGGGMYNWNSSPTVTNCTFSGNRAGWSGGGMLNNNSSSPTVTNCRFYNNTADLNGGGMCTHQFQSRPTVTNCTFTGNTATSSGGGMYNGSANPTVRNCTFTGNIARSNMGGGGGMHNNGDSPTVTDCNFSGNSADWNGGGMYNGGGTSATVNNCTFTANTALSDSQGGGGMFNGSGSPTVTNCTFSTNQASQLGGGMYNYASSPKVKNCTFLNNTSVAGGGGIYSWSSSPTVTNCSFSENEAFGGGGMFNEGSTTMVANSIFTDNTAGFGGGGIYNYSSSATVANCTFTDNTAANSGGGIYNMSSSPRVTNCILWGNVAPTSPEIHGGSPIVTYSDVQGGWPDTGNIDADPCFADVSTEDLRLLPGSPCIDAGDNNSVPADTADLDGDGNTVEPIPFDVGGLPRFVDDLCAGDTGNPGTLGPPVVDMGAYEFLPADIDGSGAVDLRDLCEFALHWRESGCGRCGGANMTCEGDVDWNDLRELCAWWLAGK
ncbi:MAG: right-handed parallel beta-helix repeat-containing protein [Planctomycetota bacterium]|jgi:parallel beta-helix repeat protein/predicted outer membrane repeat protein